MAVQLRKAANQAANKGGNKRIAENRRIEINSQSNNKIGICGNHNRARAVEHGLAGLLYRQEHSPR